MSQKKQWTRSWKSDPTVDGYVKVTEENKKDLVRVGTICYIAPLFGKEIHALDVFFIYPMMTHVGWLKILGAPAMTGGTYEFACYIDKEQTRESYAEFFKLCVTEMINQGRLYINSKDERVRFDYEKQ